MPMPSRKYLTVTQIRKLEEKAKCLGLSERLLIENASSNLAQIIDSLNLGKNFLAVAGKGNNGADTLACARKLAAKGYAACAVILAHDSVALSEEVIFQKNILERIAPVDLVNESNLARLSQALKTSDFLIDGIFGIGLSGPISSFFLSAIDLINRSKKPVVACDIPSGLHPDTGEILGGAIKAKYTITFIAPKRAFFLPPAKKFCGKILMADIGIPLLKIRQRNR